MNKANDFLTECKKNAGLWVFPLHTTGSNQPAAIFREVKKWVMNLSKHHQEDGHPVDSVRFVAKRLLITNYLVLILH